MIDGKNDWEKWLTTMKSSPHEHTPIKRWTLTMPDLPTRDSDPGPESELFCVKPGAEKQLKQYQKGHLRYQAKLDLHHNTLDDARIRIKQTLYDCQTHHKNRLLIIHGKGTSKRPSILKIHLYHWFKGSPHVMGLCSAPAKWGGTGAMLIYLTTHREEKTRQSRQKAE